MENCPHCMNKHTPRSEEEIKSLKTRLNKITGQINGVSKMIEENRYCSDILMQTAAIEKALEQVGYIVLKEHLESCVVDDIKNDDLSSLDEAIELMKKLK
ncbi:MAG: metal-sensing transcriptional repressor [Bacilli bacterium]|nr:metal-sensing transcriptional repressor [Bacilli bacterium]